MGLLAGQAQGALSTYCPVLMVPALPSVAAAAAAAQASVCRVMAK
jgi:hypothetical protein